MTTAGIDMGSKNTRVVVLEDGKVVVKTIGPSGFEQEAAARELLDQALDEAGIGLEDVEHLTVTGTGRNALMFCNSKVTTVTAAARGANYYFPGATTVIEVGAEVSHGIRTNGQGKVIDSAMNEKCAAGSGSFTESMARALGMTLEAFSRKSLESSVKIPINAQCTVFAESEVVSLIHSGTGRQDIARAVNDAIASRIAAMVRPIKGEGAVVMLGGLARNQGFVRCLKENLGVTELKIPQEPEFTDAVGAAVIAAERAA